MKRLKIHWRKCNLSSKKDKQGDDLMILIESANKCVACGIKKEGIMHHEEILKAVSDLLDAIQK